MNAPAHKPSRVVAVIQARMASQRLPGKILQNIHGKPMLWHVVYRAQNASKVDAVIVATSTSSSDDAVQAYCEQAGIPVFRGDEQNVLDRFFHAASKMEATTVVRLTGDCPLLDPTVIDDLITDFEKGGADFVTNTLVYTYPDGLDAEVFSFEALRQSQEKATLSSEREHVTPFIRNSSGFRLRNVASKNPRGKGLRWTVDDAADLAFVEKVFQNLTPSLGLLFSWESVMDLIEEKPELKEINAGTLTNEGYYKSLTKDERVPVRTRSLERSLALKAEAQALIPSVTQTFSKNPTQFVQGVAPVYLQKGKGSHVWDVDGNEYLDYPMALGPIILGHNYPRVSDAVRAQMDEGSVFTLPHPIEIDVARLLCEIIPSAERVRFGKNGSDVTSGAVRVSRAFTGRDRIATCGYHGWHDWYIATTTRNKGIPAAVGALSHAFAYNDLEACENLFARYPGEFACVILEPVVATAPAPGFLEGLRALTRKHGALLVFDEVVTGFRIGLGGAQEYYGVLPDLSCFGKAMGNGYPVSAVVGRADIMAMFDEIFFSFTFGGDALSLAAAKATISEMREKDVFPHLWEEGRKLLDGFNTLAAEFGIADKVRTVGYAPRSIIEFKGGSDEQNLLFKSYFQQECIKRGVLFQGFHNVTYSHTPGDIDYTLRVYRTVMEDFAGHLSNGTLAAAMEGPLVSAVFRKL
jgi:glutamate-1-semialdehyde aminotransferase/spore coat polysaccharide biosynthesis protein SpsF (cytidylyltransferase family)